MNHLKPWSLEECTVISVHIQPRPIDYCRTAFHYQHSNHILAYKRHKHPILSLSKKALSDIFLFHLINSFERSRSEHAYLHHHNLVDNHPPLDFILLPCQTITSCPFTSGILPPSRIRPRVQLRPLLRLRRSIHLRRRPCHRCQRYEYE